MLARWITAALVGAAGIAVAADAEEAVVHVANRPVAVFRSTFLGVGPAERARRTERTIAEALRGGGPGVVTVQERPGGRVLLIDGALALILTDDDADPLRAETSEAAARTAAQSLRQAIAETREARDRVRLSQSLGWAAVASVLAGLVLWTFWRLRQWLVARLAGVLEGRAAGLGIAGSPLVHPGRLRNLSRWLVRLAAWTVAALVAYEWLSFVLTQFPYTRAWGEQLEDFLLQVAARIGNGVLHALPDLLVAVVIFLMARVAIQMLHGMFDRVEQGQTRVGWLDRDMAAPTRRLVSVAVWLFAIAMAYPYLPGSSSEAFKGVSVLVGLMLSIGGSSLVGQAASGLILLYSRTLRSGEYVRIGETEGTVHDMGSFTTRIRTGMGEEVTLPNSLVLNSVTRNYSRAVRGSGYIVDTVVTIGYDAPWRQVHAMLVEAARRTPGILPDPAPRVVQTALSDFYVEYRLVAQAAPSEPRPRIEVLDALHGNVQDVFNEHGVQIMSPHYFGDPAEAKVVPPAGWYAAPAARPAPAASAPASTLPPGAAG